MRDYLTIGRVLKPHGVRGEMKVELSADEHTRLGALGRVFFQIGGQYAEYPVRTLRCSGSTAYLALGGVDDMDAAGGFRGMEVLAAHADVGAPKDGRWYIADLIGCRVETDAGRELGVLEDVLTYPSADVFVVRGKPGLMFPAPKDVFTRVDTEAGLIVLSDARIGEVGIFNED